MSKAPKNKIPKDKATANSIPRIVGSLLIMAAVLVYTVSNYMKGLTPPGTFLVYIIILLLPVANMLNILFQELKKR